MGKKFDAEEAAGKALFNGRTPNELRKVLNIPDDFRVDAFMGVPLDQVPYKYLRVMLDGAILEARMMKRQLDQYNDAIKKGEEMNAEADVKKIDDEKAAE